MTRKPKRKTKKQPECEEGSKARENFEMAMKTIFQSPKKPLKGKN